MSHDWLPGDLVVIIPSSLVTRLNSDEEQFTTGMQLGLVICRSHRWEEPSVLQQESHMFYVVFFGSVQRKKMFASEPDNAYISPGFYVVPGSRIIHPDEVNNPARLFGSQRLRD